MREAFKFGFSYALGALAVFAAAEVLAFLVRRALDADHAEAQLGLVLDAQRAALPCPCVAPVAPVEAPAPEAAP